MRLASFIIYLVAIASPSLLWAEPVSPIGFWAFDSIKCQRITIVRGPEEPKKGTVTYLRIPGLTVPKEAENVFTGGIAFDELEKKKEPKMFDFEGSQTSEYASRLLSVDEAGFVFTSYLGQDSACNISSYGEVKEFTEDYYSLEPFENHKQGCENTFNEVLPVYLERKPEETSPRMQIEPDSPNNLIFYYGVSETLVCEESWIRLSNETIEKWTSEQPAQSSSRFSWIINYFSL